MDIALQERLHLALTAQRRAFEAERMPSEAVRRDRLERLLAMTRQHGEALAAAMAQDFGHRARQGSLLADVFTVESGARHALKRLRRWMKTRRVETPLHFLPGRNVLMRQPLGVVGIVSPWNYPYYLAMAPAVAALAAGNRVLIKPSELTPATSALMARIVAEHFAPEEMQVITGDAEVGEAMRAVWSSSERLRKDVLRQAIPLVPFITPTVMTVADVSRALYGSTAKAAELLRLNAFDDPFRIPAGTSVKAYASTAGA